MTDRLYYTDPYLRAFDATVRRVQPHERGWGITLDRTAFYPTSGGQPSDVGTLGGHPIVDVVDEDDGEVVHVASAESGRPAPAAGASVLGEIDWPRRFDHMQQHTGQHVLSAAIVRACGVRTVSFHLGVAASTIDLERELSSAELAQAEQDANRVVWENRPVSIRFVSAAEAATLPLRKEPARGGTLRLIDVQDFDLSACGGTHVAHTGAIGIIAVAGWERFKGGQRIEFLCGGRALDRFRALRDSTAATVRLLSVLPAEIPATVERLQRDAKDQKRAVATLQSELARFQGMELAATAEQIRVGSRDVAVVLRAIDADANGLKAMASSMTATSGHVAVLVSTGRPALVVVARSSDVDLSAQTLISTLTGAFGGRGGGKPELAQAGGLDAAPEEILDAARFALAERFGT
jgi:alanyl-tRNA synthetase